MFASDLCSLSTDSAGQLNVLGHNGHALGVDGAQVGVFKQTDKISLACLLKSHHGRTLEAQVGLEVLSETWFIPSVTVRSVRVYLTLMVSLEM